MSIFQVIQNIKHNGKTYTAGEFIEAELSEFEQLVERGAMRLSEAETIEEAKALAGTVEQETPEKEEVPADQQNTWGPKKDEPKEAETAPEKASDEKTTETSDTAEKPQAGKDGAEKEASETADKPSDAEKPAETGDDL